MLAVLSLVSATEIPTLPNLDVRRQNVRASVKLDAVRETAAERLRSRSPGIQIDLDEVLTSPSFLHNRDGFLSAGDSEDEVRNPRVNGMSDVPVNDSADPHRRLKQFLDENPDLFGYDANILDGARLSRDYITEHNGMRTMVWEQQLDGIPIFEAVLYGHVTQQGELVSLCSLFVPDPAKAADAGVPDRGTVQTLPPISARQAVAVAAANISETLRTEDVITLGEAPEDPRSERRFTASCLSGDATANLVWLPMDRATMQLCRWGRRS
jgi:hypothetical protein